MPDNEVNFEKDAELLERESQDLEDAAELLKRNAQLVHHARKVANFLRQLPVDIQESLQVLMEYDIANPNEPTPPVEEPQPEGETIGVAPNPSDSLPTNGDTPEDPVL